MSLQENDIHHDQQPIPRKALHWWHEAIRQTDGEIIPDTNIFESCRYRLTSEDEVTSFEVSILSVLDPPDYLEISEGLYIVAALSPDFFLKNPEKVLEAIVYFAGEIILPQLEGNEDGLAENPRARELMPIKEVLSDSDFSSGASLNLSNAIWIELAGSLELPDEEGAVHEHLYFEVLSLSSEEVRIMYGGRTDADMPSFSKN